MEGNYLPKADPLDGGNLIPSREGQGWVIFKVPHINDTAEEVNPVMPPPG
jgi:hypothetical protein